MGRVNHGPRTKKRYEDAGWLVAGTETKKYRVLGSVEGAPAGVLAVRFYGTQDLWGFADMIALRGGTLALVQYTSGEHHAVRRAKILASPNAVLCALEGAEVHLVSWRKPAGKHRYVARVEELHDRLRLQAGGRRMSERLGVNLQRGE